MTGRGGDADRVGEVLAVHLRRLALAHGRPERRSALDAFAQAVAAAGVAESVFNRLLDGDNNSLRLALELAARLPPYDTRTVERLIPLVRNHALSASARLRAAARLLSILPPYEPLSNELLQSVIVGASRRKAFERLRLLQVQLPDYPSLSQLCRELEDGLAFGCPRCGAKLPRPQMVSHLWREHRLILEGDRVRDPWQLIEDWVREYAEGGPSELLDRSCELGRQLDPEGMVRIHRLLLANGLSDEEARANLRSKAAEQQATLCPHCFAAVGDVDEALQPLSVSRGRLAGGGYEVRIDDRGLGNRLTVTTPEQVLFDDTEPERAWNHRGSVLLKVAPLVFIGLLLAVGLPPAALPPLAPTALFLLIAFLMYIRVRLELDANADPTERVVNHAWHFLAPKLYRPMFNPDDGAFLAGLCRASIGVGDSSLRESQLERISKWTQLAVADGNASPALLAPMKRLELEDAGDRDRIALLASQIGPCFTGSLPMRVAEELLAFGSVGDMPQANRARLRVLLLARAFEVGLEPLDVQELGRVYPYLGQACASEDLDGLTRLRWLVLVKPQRPWRRIGSATAVHELARYPTLGVQYLSQRPDLLLFHAGGDADDEEDPASAPILVCEEGVLYRDILIDEPDTKIEVARRSMLVGGGYELRVGGFKRTFRGDPEQLRKRLQGWVRFLFRDLLPQARKLRPVRSGLVDPLLRQKLIACPECSRPFLSMRGEIGIPWEGADEPMSESAAS